MESFEIGKERYNLIIITNSMGNLKIKKFPNFNSYNEFLMNSYTINNYIENNNNNVIIQLIDSDKNTVFIFNAIDKIIEHFEGKLEVTPKPKVLKEKQIKAHEKLFEEIGQYIGIEVNEKKDFHNYLRDRKVKMKYISELSFVDRFNIYKYANENGYLWLIFDLGGFGYKGEYFENCVKFYEKYRLFRDKLIKQIIVNKGDLDKSVEECKDDPLYKNRVLPVINGVTYKSVADASRQLGICNMKFRRLISLGHSFEESYEKCLKRNKKRVK